MGINLSTLLYKTKKVKTFFFIFLISCFYSSFSHSQMEASIWYFGLNIGLDFHFTPPHPLDNSIMLAAEGCASICDHSGKLLFYTDGTNIYNNIHQIMVNGGALKGGGVTMTAIIVPYPDHPELYYIFTIGRWNSYPHLSYSIVNMKLDGGHGALTSRNILLLDSVEEKVTAIRHSNNNSIWIVTHKWSWKSNAFYSFEINSNGINLNPVISKCGVKTGWDGSNHYSSGYMKISPDGRKLAKANKNLGFELFNFDNSSGRVTYLWEIIDHKPYYGVGFSPDVSKLYLTQYPWNGTSGIYQFDLNSGDSTAIINSKTYIGNTVSQTPGDCQIGIDHKMYVTSAQWIAIINYPNKLGSNCGFNQRGFGWSGLFSDCPGQGLPDYIQSYYYQPDIKAENLCFSDTSKFSLSDTNYIDSVFWDFNDPLSGTSNVSNLKNPVHIYSDTGYFKIKAIVYNGILHDTFNRLIYIAPYPFVSFGINNSSQCLKGNRFVFKDSSTIIKGTFQWKWNFGDQSVDYNQNPAHTYLVPTTYPVGLTVLSDKGCSVTKIKNVFVNPMPEANFNVNFSSLCLSGNSFTFTPDSQRITHQSDLWSFGDGFNDTSHISTHHYTIAGTFNVKFITTTLEGCKDSAFKSIIVNPSPSVKFTINDSIQCRNTNVFVFTKMINYP